MITPITVETVEQLKQLPEGLYHLTSKTNPYDTWDVELQWSPGYNCMWVKEVDGDHISPVGRDKWLHYNWERV